MKEACDYADKNLKGEMIYKVEYMFDRVEFFVDE